MRVVIRGGQLVLDSGVVSGDVLIEAGRIVRVGGDIDVSGAEEINADGLHVLPGLVDSHVHFREPGMTHKESLDSGSKAAARGGVTTFLDMPNTKPPTIDQETLDDKLARAGRSCHVNYGFYIGASRSNLRALQTIERAAGIKIFAGSSTGDLLVDDPADLERIFAETTLPIAAHCEDETTVQANFKRLSGETDPRTHSRVRTPEAAAASIRLLSSLAMRYEHHLHVLHVSSRLELAALPSHPQVTAEVCIPHLFLDEGDYARLGSFAKVNPALRDAADREATWEALRSNRFRTLGTDHAPHLPEEKSLGYPKAPSGIPSIELSLPLMLDAHNRGKISLPEIVRLMSRQPAEVWHIANKGRIAEGYDADLVLVDLSARRTIHNEQLWTRAQWSPWDGQALVGWPVRTLVHGQTVVLDDALVRPRLGQAIGYLREKQLG